MLSLRRARLPPIARLFRQYRGRDHNGGARTLGLDPLIGHFLPTACRLCLAFTSCATWRLTYCLGLDSLSFPLAGNNASHRDGYNYARRLDCPVCCMTVVLKKPSAHSQVTRPDLYPAAPQLTKHTGSESESDDDSSELELESEPLLLLESPLLVATLIELRRRVIMGYTQCVKLSYVTPPFSPIGQAVHTSGAFPGFVALRCCGPSPVAAGLATPVAALVGFCRARANHVGDRLARVMWVARSSTYLRCL